MDIAKRDAVSSCLRNGVRLVKTCYAEGLPDEDSALAVKDQTEKWACIVKAGEYDCPTFPHARDVQSKTDAGKHEQAYRPRPAKRSSTVP